MKINYGRQELTAAQEVALVEWRRKKDQVRDAILGGLAKLPQDLQDFWNVESNIITGSGWIEKASKCINIPHSEVWDDTRSDVEFVSTIHN